MGRAALVIGLLFIGVVMFLMINKPASQQAVEAVETFYTYEQDGAFSDSWAMFHPFMKAKFDKAHYLQDRAHVFMSHFGVTSFDFSTGDVTELHDWKPDKGEDAMDVVYKVPVRQIYKGKYGNFAINQNVFAVKADDEWQILWNYKQ